jgi:hypothetical protein
MLAMKWFQDLQKVKWGSLMVGVPKMNVKLKKDCKGKFYNVLYITMFLWLKYQINK